jgi:hypothetical protein
MRFLRFLGFLLCVCSVMAMAGENKLGVKDVNHVKFDQAVRIGAASLPAGEYIVRHTMEGEDHVMVFQRRDSKNEFKVKCTLVPLGQKAQQSQTIYQIAGNERIVQELVFRGDTAKHVFQQ